MFRTAHDVRIDHLDALAAQRARRAQIRRDDERMRAVGRARRRGVCGSCIWGSLDETGNVAPCTCAHPDDHGPAYGPPA